MAPEIGIFLIIAFLALAGGLSFSLMVSRNRKKCGDCMNLGTVACIYPDNKTPSKNHKVCHRYSTGKTERW